MSLCKVCTNLAFSEELQTLKGFRELLAESWLFRVEEASKPTAKIVKSDFTRERPEHITFQRLMRYHDMTPQIQIAVSSYSELITGTDLIINSKNEEAEKFLEEWMRRTNFYEKFEGLVTSILMFGAALLEKLGPKDTQDVQEVDMTSIMSKKRDEFGRLEYYEQRQLEGQIIKLENIDSFIEFSLTNYSNQAWGRSLFYSLAVPRTTGYRTTAPLVEVMWGIEDAMAGIIQNNAFPITTITYPGANDEYLEKEAERWRRYKPGDKRVQKIKPEIEFFETNPASKYTDYISHMEKVFELGTQFPHDILTGDFTSRASSQTTETIVMKRVRGYQRYLCSKLKKELFEPILEQNGFNAEEVELELSFTTQNVIELEQKEVLELFKVKAITLKEIREWYQANTGMQLDDKEMEDLIAKGEEDKQMQQDKMDNFQKQKEESFTYELKEGQIKRKNKVLEENIELKRLEDRTKTLERLDKVLGKLDDE